MAYIERRVNKDKSISYRVNICLKGYPEASGTFDKLSDAKNWANITEAQIREHRYFKTKNNRHTLGELIDRYIETILVRNPKSAPNKTQQLLWWKSHLGSYNLNDTTPSLIVEAKDKLLKTIGSRGKLSAGTVNQYMSALSHAFNIAIREWNWIESSPMKNISKLKEPRGRTRYLSDAERVRLLEVCKESSYPDLYTIVVLALSTGARKMELLSLKWEDVHFADPDKEDGPIYTEKETNIICEEVLEALEKESLMANENGELKLYTYCKIHKIDESKFYRSLKKHNLTVFFALSCKRVAKKKVRNYE